MKVRIAILSIFVVILSFLDVKDSVLFNDVASEFESQVLSQKTEEVFVTRVIDGDTIEVETGEKVRYIGIDTPETKHPQKGVECFGKEATEYNKRLVEGKVVRLEKDVSEKDKYGRLLRYVYVDDPSDTEKQIFVNEELVKDGYAFASTYPPDVKYQEKFTNAQKDARENNLGLWDKCRD